MRKLVSIFIGCIMLMSLCAAPSIVVQNNNADTDIAETIKDELSNKLSYLSNHQISIELTQQGDVLTIDYTISPDEKNGQEVCNNIWQNLDQSIARLISAIQKETATYSESTLDIINENREESFSKKDVSLGSKEYNVCAWGVYAILYVRNPNYDDIKVEYRVIYKSQKGQPKFEYLGTTPFAYFTKQMYENDKLDNPFLQNIKEYRPLVIENEKDVYAVEFRLSKEGFQTIVVNPIKDIFIGGGGPVMFIPLNKLKPLK
ncbi:MAG: hypothetical protein IKO26_08265 [Paludibacteraceae bacterium]|nr:hypothetical protein [Paludibacteraceae bacterium]